MTDHDLMSRDSYRAFEQVTIRFSDQDPMGHVNNVAIAAYFESGRVGYINQLRSRIAIDTTRVVLAHFSVDYRREVMFPGTVEVGGRLLGVGRKSFNMAFGLFQDGSCCATSTAVMVFFDPKTRKSMAPAESVLESLRAEMAREAAP
jgi:acyl-CoA thioester hydrolase